MFRIKKPYKTKKDFRVQKIDKSPKKPYFLILNLCYLVEINVDLWAKMNFNQISGFLHLKDIKFMSIRVCKDKTIVIVTKTFRF